MPPELREAANRAIASRLTCLPEFQAARRILFYISYGEEVDTRELMQRVFGAKVVLVPRVNGNDLHVHEIASFEDLRPGAFGILEPSAEAPEVAPTEAELVVVPGAAFDLHGARIGYGKGYYDRLLEGVNAAKIGLAYDRQIVAAIPVEPHDIPMDLLITNERLVDFR